MPLTQDDLLLKQLESHEERIQRVEDIIPTVAGVEKTLQHISATIESIHDVMVESRDKMSEEVSGLRAEISNIKTGHQTHENLLAILKEDRENRTKALKAVVKWVFGIIGAVAGAVLIAWIIKK